MKRKRRRCGELDSKKERERCGREGKRERNNDEKDNLSIKRKEKRKKIKRAFSR